MPNYYPSLSKMLFRWIALGIVIWHLFWRFETKWKTFYDYTSFRIHKIFCPNYVDKFLAFFDHPPPCLDILYLINVDKNLHFLTTYPPSLVNVVCEWPLSVQNCELRQKQIFMQIKGQCVSVQNVMLYSIVNAKIDYM